MNRVTTLQVLLIEDNLLDAKTVIRALNGSRTGSYEVTHVIDLHSAMEVLDNTTVDNATVDCILFDLSLPDSQGLVPVDTLGARFPLVVLTGLEDPDVAIAAVERGAQDYLTKSTITPEVIERALRYAVARHASEVQLASAATLLETMHDRERIARDLHDTVIQRLFATGMGLQAGAARDDGDELRRRALNTVSEIDEAIRELREAIFGLNTSDENASLAADIERIAASEADVLGFVPHVFIGDLDRLDNETHNGIVAVVSEGLANVARHAAANAVEVIVSNTDDEIVVQVIDNGRGFGATTAGPTAGDSGAPKLSGRGLINLETRAHNLGGRFRIGPAIGGGSLLEWAIPISRE